MKVALISGIFPPDIGGPATFIPRFASFLQSRNHEVKVLTLADNLKNPVKNTFAVKRIRRSIPLPVRFWYVVVKVSLLPPKTAVFANGLHEEVGVSLFIRKRSSVAKIVGDPVWERARNNGDTDLTIIDFNQTKLKLKYKIQRILLVFSLNKFDNITCPSQELCEFVASWGVKKPISFIGNGVNVDLLPEETDEEFDLICVSRLVPWKNIDKHLEISAALNLKIAVVGSGPLESSLKEFAKKINCKATFFGELDGQAVRSLLSKSRVFILLSNYEGMSFALLEAMALGLPSIVSDIPANQEVVLNGVSGIVVNPMDWKKSTKFLEELFHNNEKYQRFSNQARKEVLEKFDEYEKFSSAESLLK